MGKQKKDRQWDAEAFNQASSPQLRSAIKVIEKFADQSELSHQKVCDVGSGAGKTTEWLSSYFNHSFVVGMDNSADMVRKATAQFPVDVYSNLRFLKKDAQRNTFNQTFNTVTSFFCLQWVDKPKLALQGMHQSLVPGGDAFFIIPLRHEEMWRGIELTAESNNWKAYFTGYENPRRFFTQSQYESMIEEVGFKINACDYLEASYGYTKQSLKPFIASWLPHLERLDKTQHDKFLSDVVDTISTLVKTENDKMDVTFRWLEVFCQRPKIFSASLHSNVKGASLYWNAPPAQGTRASVKNRGQEDVLLSLNQACEPIIAKF